MNGIFENTLELIGKTPIIKLNNIKSCLSLNSNIYAKVEFFNPAGSVKDRIAYGIIEDLEKNKIINKDSTIIEPSSGNTGIGISMVCAVKGYKAIIVMPESMSIERRKLISAYGAKVVLTDKSLGMKGAIQRAEELSRTIPNSIIPSQFTNKVNPRTHYNTTGPEIYSCFNDDLDYFISGVGTGGTISGAGKFLKEKNSNIKIIAVEPESSAVISGKNPRAHKIQGIGAGFLPDTLDRDIIDNIEPISDEDAFETSRLLAKSEGLLVGISSGAALCAAIKIAKEFNNKNILCVLPDTGERYLSTELFNME